MKTSGVDIDFTRRSLIAPKTSILPRVSGSASRRNENRIIINVGGIRYETYKSTLKNIPDTRLSWLTNTHGHNPDFDPHTGEYFFDRHPGVFNMILNYYRTGKLHAPTDVCGPLFEEELAFWGLDEKQIEPCCWSNYRAHRDAQETLAEMDGGDVNSDNETDTESCLEDIREKFGIIEEHIMEEKSWWRRNKPKLWKLLDEPKSSMYAKAFAFVSFAFLITSIMTFCMESHILFRVNRSANFNGSILSVRDKEIYTKPMLFLDVIEYLCVSFFTLEIILRVMFCPSLKGYFKQVFNWIDISVVIPCYLCFVLLLMDQDVRGSLVFRVINAFRLLRIFRILKLTIHVSGLKILGHTIRASAKELLLLILVLIIGVLIFACLIYYAEQVNEPDINSFPNIPKGFWWAVVTMTTLGYGDLYPRTALGYIIGTVCAVCGLLMLSLPVPVIVSHFTLYYTHAQARAKLPKKIKKRALINAANALVDQDSAETSSIPAEITNHVTGSNQSLNRTSSDDSAIGSSYDKVKNAAETYSRSSCTSGRVFTTPTRFTPRGRRYRRTASAPAYLNVDSEKNGHVGISVIFTNETPIQSEHQSLASSTEDLSEYPQSPINLSPSKSFEQQHPHRKRRVSLSIAPAASRRGSIVGT